VARIPAQDTAALDKQAADRAVPDMRVRGFEGYPARKEPDKPAQDTAALDKQAADRVVPDMRALDKKASAQLIPGMLAFGGTMSAMAGLDRPAQQAGRKEPVRGKAGKYFAVINTVQALEGYLEVLEGFAPQEPRKPDLE
jgi:hypothetical protein